MQYSTFIILLMIFFYTLTGFEAKASQTFYVDNACTYNGDGTGDTCAQHPGGNGAWSSLRAAQYCAGVNPGDTIEIRRGKGMYSESMKPRIACSGTPGNPTTIQNYPGEHVIFDGTIDIKDSAWTHKGNGVYLCTNGTCGTSKKFPFTAWYDTGSGEKRLNLTQSKRTCDQTLRAGEMRYTTRNQVCVRLDDSSNPGHADFFRIPYLTDAISIIAYHTDYLAIRKNPKGGSFTLQRYRDHGVSMTTVNLGIEYHGLDIGWVMDRCINQSEGGRQPAGYKITNNHIHHCGQEGIRWSQDTSPEGRVSNNLIEHIQVEPLYDNTVDRI